MLGVCGTGMPGAVARRGDATAAADVDVDVDVDVGDATTAEYHHTCG